MLYEVVYLTLNDNWGRIGFLSGLVSRCKTLLFWNEKEISLRIWAQLHRSRILWSVRGAWAVGEIGWCPHWGKSRDFLSNRIVSLLAWLRSEDSLRFSLEGTGICSYRTNFSLPHIPCILRYYDVPCADRRGYLLRDLYIWDSDVYDFALIIFSHHHEVLPLLLFLYFDLLLVICNKGTHRSGITLSQHWDTWLVYNRIELTVSVRSDGSLSSTCCKWSYEVDLLALLCWL